MASDSNGGRGSINVREFLFGNQTDVVPSENIVESPYAGVICIKSEVVLKPIISEITLGLIGGLISLFVLFAVTLLYGICITRKLNQINASLAGEPDERQPRSKSKDMGLRCASLKSIHSLPENQDVFNNFNAGEVVPNGTFALATAPNISRIQHHVPLAPVFRGLNPHLYPNLSSIINNNPNPHPWVAGGSPYCVSSNQLLGKGCNVIAGSVEDLQSFVCTHHNPELGCSGVFPDEN